MQLNPIGIAHAFTFQGYGVKMLVSGRVVGLRELKTKKDQTVWRRVAKIASEGATVEVVVDHDQFSRLGVGQMVGAACFCEQGLNGQEFVAEAIKDQADIKAAPSSVKGAA